jgi:hypothetical protein
LFLWLFSFPKGFRVLGSKLSLLGRAERDRMASREGWGGWAADPAPTSINFPSALSAWVLAIMAPIGFSSYCTLKLLFSRVTVLPQV